MITYLYFSPVIAQEKKIATQLELGYGLGEDADYDSGQLFLTPLYKQNEQLSFGLGVGLKYYYRTAPKWMSKKEKRLISIPIYAAFDYTLPVGRMLQPFLNLKIGYGISSRKFYYPEGSQYSLIEGNVNIREKGSFFISPAAGVAYPINHNQMLRLALTYDLQKIKTKINNDIDHKENKTFNLENISLRLGWTF